MYCLYLEIVSGGTSNGSGENEGFEEIDDVVADLVPSEKAVKKSKKGKKRKSDSLSEDNDDLEVINTSAGKVVVEDDADVVQVTVESAPKDALKNKTNEKKKQRKKKAKRGLKTSETAETVEEEVVADEDEDEDYGNSENGTDAENPEDENFQETEWLKLGVPELVVKALKEQKFNAPTTIQVCLRPLFCFYHSENVVDTVCYLLVFRV